MAAQLVEHGSLHREDSPVGIVGRMRTGQHVERGLEASVIGKRPAVSCQQRLVAGMGDGSLFEHGGSLRPLSGGAERLAIGRRKVGILRIGARKRSP